MDNPFESNKLNTDESILSQGHPLPMKLRNALVEKGFVLKE
jgi:hypothetical protein